MNFPSAQKYFPSARVYFPSARAYFPSFECNIFPVDDFPSCDNMFLALDCNYPPLDVFSLRGASSPSKRLGSAAPTVLCGAMSPSRDQSTDQITERRSPKGRVKAGLRKLIRPCSDSGGRSALPDGPSGVAGCSDSGGRSAPPHHRGPTHLPTPQNHAHICTRACTT